MNQIMKILFLVASLLVATLANAQVGVVTEINGDITLQRENVEFSLSPGVDLFPGDIIRSGRNSSAQFDMDDGSMISISSNAEISIADYQLREDKSVVRATINLVSGWLRFAVAKLKGGESSFHLSMPTAVLGVRGTEGVIEVSGADDSLATEIFLEEGEVEVAEKIREGRLSGQKVSLKSGQFAERRFGRMLFKRHKISEMFKKRLPLRLRAKLKRRIKLLKRRGVPPRKIRRIFKRNIQKKKMREYLKKHPEKRREFIQKMKKKPIKEKRLKFQRERREKKHRREAWHKW